MMYICQLKMNQQEAIKSALIRIGINGVELDNAMDGRLQDLEDVIDITLYM